MQLQISLGDVALQEADAIVSSLSPDASGSSGVERAIRRRGGEAVLEPCRQLVAARGTAPMAGIVISSQPGQLCARWLLHARGPDYRATNAAQLLTRTYWNVLREAASLGAKSVALPSISTGRRAFPVVDAARIAIRAARSGPFQLHEVRFVLSNRALYRAFVHAFLLET